VVTLSLHAEVRLERDAFSLDVALEAEAGQTLALLGPNGSGKSTLIQSLGGLTEAPATVILDGEDLSSLPPERRPIGIMFQDLRLFPNLSAVENVAFPLRAQRTSKTDARGRAITLLDELGLPTERLRAAPRDLSGGEAQRVALGRALITRPKLLLLDEPTAALDVASRARLRAMLHETLRGFPGVRILVTHDPVEAMTLGDRLAVVEEGRLTQVGSPADLRGTPGTPYIADLVGVNLYVGRLEPLEEGAGRLVTVDGELTVAWPAGYPANPTDSVTATLRPADVVLHTSRPEGGSARNTLRGPVASISMDGSRARVQLGSHPPVVAEVTIGSIDRMDIREGSELWASCKAVELDLHLPG
jgi:molybdate transport system ATP-binding protein